MTFQFFIGGYFSGHFEVVLNNDELHFYVSDYPTRIEQLEPTHILSIKQDNDWQKLVNYLTVLKWKRKYVADILDGIQWELTYKNENKKLKCYGSNKFPDDFDNLTSLIKGITKKHKIPDQLVEKFILLNELDSNKNR